MIVRLSADTPHGIETLGGKAMGLVRLLRAGCPVPDAWCIPVGVAVDDAALRRFWDEHPGEVFAVRSSATAEDLAESSFAGIYTTVLGVDSREALVAAVRACRAAFHGDHAIAYRRRRGIEDAGDIAVVLQRLLRPDVAGVMMTENPQRPFAGELVIDAAYGLGEGVVGGRVEPDHLVLTRDGNVLERALGEKATALRYVAGQGIVPIGIDAADRARCCLDEAQLAQLVQLARRVAPRSDVEWAFERGRLYVLQQRPITGLPPREPRVVCARQFGDEYLAGYGMPLTRTFLVRWIRDVAFHDVARLMGRDDLLALEPIVEHEGYHYMNGEYAMGLLRAVPGGARDTGPLTWFSPAYQARLRAAPLDLGAMFGFLVAPFRDRGALIHQNVAALDAHCRSIEQVVVPKLSQDYTSLTQDEWAAQLAEVDAFGREHFRVIRWGMTFYGPTLHALLQQVLARSCEDDGSLYQAIVSGLSGTRTAEINRDIHALGLVAREHGLESERFARALSEFLARHGHRAPSREITDPRWRETPEVVIALVRAQLARTDDSKTPEALEREATAKRDAAERDALARVRNPLLRQWFRTLVTLTRDYTRYRENQRYHLDYVLTHCRSLILEQARRLASRGVLGRPEDVFLLEADELNALARGDAPTSTLTATIDARRAHYLAHRHRLPATYLFDGVETEGELAEGPRTIAHTHGDGQGASRGRARGPVRVIRDVMSLGAVRPGEVLVVSTIDPAWTSVFPIVAGLVTETSGLLSHGALLAREYGIPAVAGVRNATARFVDGETIEIDGALGTVRRVT